MNWAVIMTGGKGTRFWPESRARRPKPFLKLLGNKSLLEETVNRLTGLFPSNRILIVLQESLVKDARRLLPRIPKKNFLGEPVGRNTAPCCVYAASQIERRDPEAKLVFLPADQLIEPVSLFLKTLRAGLDLVDEKPVLIGIQPDSPHTGYGYLEVDQKKKTNGLWSFRVRRFQEKPSLSEARRFLKKGNFFWNGGIFIWRLDAFRQAIRKHFHRLYPAFQTLEMGLPKRPGLARLYNSLPSISIDYAVMERMKNVHCLLAPFELKDLGGWEGISKLWSSDREKNRTHGNVLFVKSRGNIVKSNRRLVALVGAEDLVVVDTEDALLVCHRSKAEEIRDVVIELEKRKAHKYL